jgi:site-specific recombinase XerD
MSLSKTYSLGCLKYIQKLLGDKSSKTTEIHMHISFLILQKLKTFSTTRL